MSWVTMRFNNSEIAITTISIHASTSMHVRNFYIDDFNFYRLDIEKQDRFPDQSHQTI